MTTIKSQPSLKAMAESSKDENRPVTKSVPTFDADPRVIKVRPGFNMRPVDPDHVANIRAAMEGGAQFPPMWVVVEDGQIYMLDGEHRLTAYLGLPTIPARVKVMEFKPNGFPPTMAQQILFMMGCAKGKAALPLQVGTQFALLMNTYGMSYAEIAKSDGVSVQHVKDMIRLTQQEPGITNLIKDGTVTATTALKLVKQVGGKEAGETLKKAAVVAKSEGKKVTQKTINKVAPTPPTGITEKAKKEAAKSVVKEVSNRSDAVKDHLRAMLESPTITGTDSLHVKAALAICEGKRPEVMQPTETVENFMERMNGDDNEVVIQAIGIINLVRTGQRHLIPAPGSPEAQNYGHYRWLEKTAAGEYASQPPVRRAAHWFLAVLKNNRSDKETAPPPSVMAFDEAVQAEIDSQGAVSAVELCPEAEPLINYLRGAK